MYTSPTLSTKHPSLGASALEHNGAAHCRRAHSPMLAACLVAVVLVCVLSACGKSYEIQKGSIATLDTQVPLDDIDFDNAAGEAVRSYAEFLEQSDASQLTPEAIRRLADLQIERGLGNQSGRLSDKLENNLSRLVDKLSDDISNDSLGSVAEAIGVDLDKVNKDAVEISAVQQGVDESQEDFEARAAGQIAIDSGAEASLVDAKTTIQAIKLYKKLLRDFPDYPRTDQVLYQLSRAYQEIGDIDTAVSVLTELVTRFPDSRYMPESNFRRGEYYFVRERFFEAESAYQEVIDYGIGTQFYEHSLYKQGWAMFKQSLYEEALTFFFALLDVKLVGDYERGGLEEFEASDRQRLDDTFRSISLTFSYIGGPEDINRYFKNTGERSYEPFVYSHFAEFFFSKNRYSDAADAYRHFIKLRPNHFQSPFFQMRIVEIYNLGGFLLLVIDEKKVFARDYDINSNYWTYFDIKERPKVVEFARTNLQELATHHHALYQYRSKNKGKPEEIKEAYDQAIGWYRVLIQSFPNSEEAPQSNYSLAELYFFGKEFQRAAREFNKTAYKYGDHEKASEAGYAEVASLRGFRESIEKGADAGAVGAAQDRIIDASIKFGRTFPQHEKAATVIIAVAEDLFKLKRYEQAISEARFAIITYGEKLDPKLRFSMWRIVAYSSFDLKRFGESELAFAEALKLAPQTTDADKAEYANLVDNLAASVFRQGEVLRDEGKLAEAAEQFLRIRTVAPNSKYRPNAEFDAAAVFITLKLWNRAIETLLALRTSFPQHELQPSVTQNLAISYKENKQLILAAQEFERVETESKDEDLRREALLEAADLYKQAKQEARSISVLEKYVTYFPKPLEFALETRFSIAEVYKQWGKTERYYTELRAIIKADKEAGAERTERTRYLAGNAGLVFAEPLYNKFAAIRLTVPLEQSVVRKQQAMEKALDAYTELSSYKVANVTSAATYYIASAYQNMAESLIESDKPGGLSELELEEYEILIEEQAFPFEDNAVVAFEKNVELLELGVYDEWVKKSLAKLAELLPLQYAKSERRSNAWEQIL